MSTGNYKNVGKKGVVYATSKKTERKEVSNLIDTIVKKFAGKPKKIVVLTGTHGTKDGNLVNEKYFYVEDKYKELQYLIAVNVGPHTPKNTWERYFKQTKTIIILAWCHSKNWKDLPKYNR